VVVFTSQNYEAVKVKFLLWTFEASRAVVLFLAILIGIIVGWAISVAERKKNRTTIQSVADIFRDEKGKLLPSIKEIKRLNQTTIVRFQGMIDSSTIPIISKNIKSEMKMYLDRNILLDFKEAAHIDSSTLAYMISLLNQLKKRNRKLGLINTSSEMDNYLDIEKARSSVHVFKNEKAALKSLMRA
jgi:anti-anti-sigma factor